jgi:hypothetical protein
VPFLSSFDGWNQRLAWEREEQQWRSERESIVLFFKVRCAEEED